MAQFAEPFHLSEGEIVDKVSVLLLAPTAADLNAIADRLRVAFDDDPVVRDLIRIEFGRLNQVGSQAELVSQWRTRAPERPSRRLFECVWVCLPVDDPLHNTGAVAEEDVDVLVEYCAEDLDGALQRGLRTTQTLYSHGELRVMSTPPLREETPIPVSGDGFPPAEASLDLKVATAKPPASIGAGRHASSTSPLDVRVQLLYLLELGAPQSRTTTQAWRSIVSDVLTRLQPSRRYRVRVLGAGHGLTGQTPLSWPSDTLSSLRSGRMRRSSWPASTGVLEVSEVLTEFRELMDRDVTMTESSGVEVESITLVALVSLPLTDDITTVGLFEAATTGIRCLWLAEREYADFIGPAYQSGGNAVLVIHPETTEEIVFYLGSGKRIHGTA